MKNGIYIEDYCNHKNSEIHYKNNIIIYIKHSNGAQYWFNEKGQEHRIDGPAVIWSDGSKFWCENGKHHRLDGPAMEYFDGYKYWFLDGKEINVKSQKEFEQYLLLQVFE